MNLATIPPASGGSTVTLSFLSVTYSRVPSDLLRGPHGLGPASCLMVDGSDEDAGARLTKWPCLCTYSDDGNFLKKYPR